MKLMQSRKTPEPIKTVPLKSVLVKNIKAKAEIPITMFQQEKKTLKSIPEKT